MTRVRVIPRHATIAFVHDRQTRIECYAKIFMRLYSIDPGGMRGSSRNFHEASPRHRLRPATGETIHMARGKKEYNFEEDAYGKNDRRGVSTFLQRPAQGKLKLD